MQQAAVDSVAALAYPLPLPRNTERQQRANGNNPVIDFTAIDNTPLSSVVCRSDRPLDVAFAAFRPQFDPYRIMELGKKFNSEDFLNDAAAMAIEGGDGQQWQYADWSRDASARRIFLEPTQQSRVTYANRQSGRELTMHDSPDAIWSAMLREARGPAGTESSWQLYQKMRGQRGSEIYNDFFGEKSINGFGYCTQGVRTPVAK